MSTCDLQPVVGHCHFIMTSYYVDDRRDRSDDKLCTVSEMQFHFNMQYVTAAGTNESAAGRVATTSRVEFTLT